VPVTTTAPLDSDFIPSICNKKTYPLLIAITQPPFFLVAGTALFEVRRICGGTLDLFFFR